uniref:Neuropeptide-Like Protein n=1 Tax=Steinernema glaseri TaxID=37863 RepID=A0A1I8A9G9_9BILA
MAGKLFWFAVTFLLLTVVISREEVSGYGVFAVSEPKEPLVVHTRAYLSRNRGRNQEFRFPLVSESALNRMMNWRSFVDPYGME